MVAHQEKEQLDMALSTAKNKMITLILMELTPVGDITELKAVGGFPDYKPRLAQLNLYLVTL